MGSPQPSSRLWVCWQETGISPNPTDSVLTFLLPSAEQRLKAEHSGEVLFGREASLPVRKAARTAYLAIIARLAAVPISNGKTLRQLMASPGRASRWWYHPVSFKGCETDPTFDRIIALFTIVRIARDRGIRDLVLVGGPEEITEILKETFNVRAVSESRSRLLFLCRALISRLAFGVAAMRVHRLTRRKVRSSKFDVVFMGFWPWSVGSSEHGSIADAYFRDLPSAIKTTTSLSIGWFAWLDELPMVRQHTSLRKAVRLANEQESVFILQSALNFSDLIKAIFDLKPLTALIGVWNRSEFRRAFNAQELNLMPLFKQPLIGGALNYSIPYGELVQVATTRAAQKYRVQAAYSFLEHFVHARAHYQGIKEGSAGAANYMVQHASYCSEKTFLFLDPELEFTGKPDGYAVPHADKVFAMGDLARELFLQCGYRADQVVVTGSPRYDRIKADDLPRTSSGISLLLIGGIAPGPDLEMIDAACEATRSLPGVSVAFRKHPLSRIEDRRIRMTEGSLDEDLKNADIVLFTYSTVAEEAFLRGRAVWQWLPQGFNGSALAEVIRIPQFGSVESLTEALSRYRSDPASFAPDANSRQIILSKLFCAVDGQAANRIATVAGV